MPASNKSGLVHYWAGKLPGSLGHMWSLEIVGNGFKVPSITIYDWLSYAVDNGRFLCWLKGIEWDEAVFIELCDRVRFLPKKPLFLVVPDVRLNAEATIEEWHKWESRLRKYGVPLAFAAQDGMTANDVPQSADWVFMGGTDEWRFPLLKSFVDIGKPTHVGRVNNIKRLFQCYHAGVKSCDGTGWFRSNHGKPQVNELIYFLRWRAGEIQLPEQQELFDLGAA